MIMMFLISFMVMLFSISNAGMLYMIDNQPNPEPTATILETSIWYLLPTLYQNDNLFNTLCIKPNYLPTCDNTYIPNSWLFSFPSYSYNSAIGMPCYLQATCSSDHSTVTITLYSEPTCTTSPRIIDTVHADSYRITHLVRFGISVIANCEGPTTWPQIVQDVSFTTSLEKIVYPFSERWFT